MSIAKVYTPLIKVKSFDPSPVAGNIPLFADSQINPEVRGTRLFTEWWDEQIDRCVNGYKTGGYNITGRYYFYLNYVPIDGLMGLQYPWFVDLDYEIFQLIDEVKHDHCTGIITLKARRKGLSEKIQGGVFNYGIRFIESYRGGVAAGLETYTKGLKSKFDKTNSRIHKEMRLNVLKDNDEEYVIGYERKDAIGGFVEESYGGHISYRTMFDNPKKFEGEYFHDVLLEEAGQFVHLYDTYDSIRPALEFGAEMLGTFYIQGTGGNILTVSRDFHEMYNNAEKYGLRKLWVPGNRLYFPFFGNKYRMEMYDSENSMTIQGMPNFRHLKDYQKIGIEDLEAGKQYIKQKMEEYARMSDKQKLKKFAKSHPLTEEDAFTSGGRNDFDDDVLYAQLNRLESEDLHYRPYVLDWVYIDTPEGRKRKMPLQVGIRPASKNDPDWKIVWIYQMPLEGYRDLDIIGIDGYNQDKTNTSSSLGATIVVRRGNWLNLQEEGIHDAEYPICLYYQRPPKKEIFYEISLMISVLYGAVRNTMINAEQEFVIDYYKKNGGTMYLSSRPKKFDAKDTKQVHEYGAKMTSSSKPLILNILQSMISEYGMYIFFPQVVRDALAYDEEYIGTDWDSIDALAYAKMRIEDMKGSPRSNVHDDRSEEPRWVKDIDGNIVLLESSSSKERTTKEGRPKIMDKDTSGGWVGFR